MHVGQPQVAVVGGFGGGAGQVVGRVGRVLHAGKIAVHVQTDARADAVIHARVRGQACLRGQPAHAAFPVLFTQLLAVEQPLFVLAVLRILRVFQERVVLQLAAHHGGKVQRGHLQHPHCKLQAGRKRLGLAYVRPEVHGTHFISLVR